MKIWQRNDIYNFSDEFNRIEKYIEWCKEWLAYYKIQVIVELTERKSKDLMTI